jgi:threonylcarbamoyladenosine tRNA methylthiotransferase MtaB
MLNRKNNQLIVVENLSSEFLLKTLGNLNLNKNCKNEDQTKNKVRSSVFRTRAFIKVTDGCNNFCSYCIIPFVRGPEKSRELSDIIEEVSKLEEEGVKEVVITGINTGNYNMGIENLLKHLLKFSTIPRIRVSSLRPSKISSELIDIMQNERICPHFHVSLQSGSDKILKLMNRLDYNSKDFLDKLQSFYFKTQLRNPFIAADVIVGFPGEDGGSFNETLSVLAEAPVNKLHVFVFSPRPGTKAFAMSRGDSKENRRRRDMLLEFSDKRYLQALKNMINKEVKILWEKNNVGRTENYYPVLGSAKSNTIQKSLVRGVDENKLQLLI